MTKSEKSQMRTTGALIMALQAFCATSAWSATQVSYKVDFIAPPETLTLDDVMDVDELGFDCIHEDKIDLAFHATGKGVRMPRTCLPEPCNKALVPEELALLVGRPATENEWDEYYARYADVCRKEIPTLSTDDASIDTGGDPLQDFWTPLVTTFLSTPNTGSLTSSTPNQTSSSDGGATPGFSFSTSTNPNEPSSSLEPDIFTLTSSSTSSGAATSTTAVSTSISPVPLPAALWMLLAGLACFIPWKRRQTQVS